MENVSPIIDTVKLVGPTIWKYVKFQTIPNSYVKEWDSQIKSLQRRFGDVGAELESQLMGVGKIPKQEVEDWRDKAKKATEANADQSTKCGCFSNICRSKHFDEMAQELKRVFDEGEKYIHGGEVLVMDDPSKVKDHFMGEFQQLCRSLGDRQKDIQSTLNQQLHFGKIAKDEVKNWLKEVEEKLKTSRVEVSEGGCLSPSGFAKLLQERNGELKKLLDEGEKYTDAGAVLVKDDPLRIRGVPLGDEECYGRDAALIEIPKHLKYDMLTTLLMPQNNVVTIPESFFMQTPGLKILDLSRNHLLTYLPGSLSHLENLTTLILKHCGSLKEVPSLSKCLALTKLDLHDTGIVEVPDGVEMLINLMYLHVKDTKIESLPEGMLPKLSNLQYLSVGTTRIIAEEVVKLRKLEHFKAKLGENLDEMSILLGFMKNQVKWLRSNTLQVEPPVLVLENGMFGILLNGKPIFMLDYTNVDGDEDRDFGWVNSILVNHDLSLRCLVIVDMEKIECVFGSSFNPLQTLEALYLYGLGNLTSVFDEKALGLLAPPSSSNSCFPLKVIFIKKCPALKNLVSPALLLCYLQNLEYILIKGCENMEEIISFTSEEEEALHKITLPKLKKLKLKKLHALKSICNRRSSVLICDSLEVLEINVCKELKRMSLYLPQLDDAQPSPSPLKEIITYQDEWESWEWPQPNAKGVLLPKCDFLQ